MVVPTHFPLHKVYSNLTTHSFSKYPPLALLPIWFLLFQDQLYSGLFIYLECFLLHHFSPSPNP